MLPDKIRKFGILAVVAALGGIGMWWLLPKDSSEANVQAAHGAGEVGVSKAGTGKIAAARRSNRQKVRRWKSTGDDGVEEIDGEESEFPEEDRPTMKALHKAYDDDDLKGVVEAVKVAAESKSKDVRAEALHCLDWFGAKALPEMMPFLADPDPEIAENALSSWSSAMNDLEDPAIKAGIVEQTMAIITNPDMLDEIANQLTDLPEAMAVQCIVNIVGGDNPKAVAAAKESYEFLTGDEFTTAEAAQAYIKKDINPEE